MAGKSDIEVFLGTFKAKMDVFSVVFLERDKNLQALIDLEMTKVGRREVLRELQAEDYYRGPIRDRDDGPDLWEFGRLLNKREVYIKITMGTMSKPVICISFHLAERAMKYPFK